MILASYSNQALSSVRHGAMELCNISSESAPENNILATEVTHIPSHDI